ncbi:MAG: hypothetical protein H6721_21130 [Sandaracinus sp.]|nr:hypothetical protein [Sandaracinus sp.]MCB9634637.1 hypothetical protein [Sandaracinus sp.]
MSAREAPPKPRRPVEPFDRLRWIAIVVSLVALGLGSALPTGDFVDSHGAPVSWQGIAFLACGWFGPVLGAPVCGWYANPMLMLAWLLLALRRYRGATIVACIGLVLAASSLWLFDVEVMQNEGGVNNLRLRGFSAGFYVWWVALLAPVGFSIAGWVRDRRFVRGPLPDGR